MLLLVNKEYCSKIKINPLPVVRHNSSISVLDERLKKNIEIVIIVHNDFVLYSRKVKKKITKVYLNLPDVVCPTARLRIFLFVPEPSPT